MEAYENQSTLNKHLPKTGQASKMYSDKNVVGAIDHDITRDLFRLFSSLCFWNYQPKEEVDQYELEGIDHSVKDERNLCNWIRSWRIGGWQSSSSKSTVDVIATRSCRDLCWPRVPLKGTRIFATVNSCGSFNLCYCGSSRRQWDPNSKNIIVEVLNIGPITITVPHSWKVQDICECIKRMHEEQIDMKRKVYILTYNGNALEKSKKLSDYFIQNWATLKFKKQ